MRKPLREVLLAAYLGRGLGGNNGVVSSPAVPPYRTYGRRLPMTHATSIGLDVHARTVAACAFNPFTGVVEERVFGPDPLPEAAEIARGAWASSRRSASTRAGTPTSAPASPTSRARASSPAGLGRSGGASRGRSRRAPGRPAGATKAGPGRKIRARYVMPLDNGFLILEARLQ